MSIRRAGLRCPMIKCSQVTDWMPPVRRSRNCSRRREKEDRRPTVFALETRNEILHGTLPPWHPFFLSRCRPLGRFRAVSRRGGLLVFARKPRRASFNEKLISRVSRRLLQQQVFILFFAVLRLPVSLRRRHSCPIQPPSFASYLSLPRPRVESTLPLLLSLFALLALFTPRCFFFRFVFLPATLQRGNALDGTPLERCDVPSFRFLPPRPFLRLLLPSMPPTHRCAFYYSRRHGRSKLN